MNIKIADNDYQLKYTVRGLFVYEQITGTTFSPDKLLNEYTLMFSILIANNPHFRLTFDEMIEYCDQDSSIFFGFRKWLLEELKLKATLTGPQEESDSEVKKN